MASVLIATDDFVHLKSRFAAVDGRGSQEAIDRAKPLSARATSLSTVGMTHERLTLF
jgi:hypothetical protein